MIQKEIKNYIKAKLDELKGDEKPLADVYDYHSAEFNGYPAATFEPSDIESDFESQHENLRKYIFRIVVHQEISQAGMAESIEILQDASDAIIDAFDQDYKLGGLIDWLEAVPGSWRTYESPTGDIRAVEIKLVCNKSVDIS